MELKPEIKELAEILSQFPLEHLRVFRKYVKDIMDNPNDCERITAEFRKCHGLPQ